MAGNHVEQLESRVRELEATLDGLTDELVDTKDRVETLEAAIAEDGSADRRSQAGIVDGELLGQGTEADTGIAEEAEAKRESDTATGAQADGTNGNDGTEQSGTEGATDGIEETEEMDGIIVA
jgi:hypothetical protein